MNKEDIGKYLISIASGVITGSAAVMGTGPAVASVVGVTSALAVTSYYVRQGRQQTREKPLRKTRSKNEK